ncbi:MAG TPA: 30S ribosomal protein S3 [Candidatus Omnitrophota bacterium]|nr:30S ribosomal protein S3 [Candidatus Omnitrophota bacterium]MDD5738069.1 30S ribosomal protein S3 [Candidatus Omnitrophota bacterium]HOX09800.1 30S ribosomal protein S3 [Candidatus Omnitrophota bacterium]HPN66712.1 30S ribosomal protein S3 [Candidatus Omnitrophota bacterium]HRZ67530.1 30S ribosomal protein S3 [Candidatus Omnitrophota bacterium]
MGHKVNPISMRLGYIKNWRSRWFSKKKDFADFLVEDLDIRKYVKKNFSAAGIALIEVERASNKAKVIIHTARPGIIIGRKGADIDRLRDDLQDKTKKEIYIEIKEVKNASVDAQLVAENIAFQLEKRIAFRRALKKAVQQAMTSGALGIKVKCAGRLGGAEMSRTEGYKEGKVPLQTFRADIDYGFAEAMTTYGLIGVKAWVYKGDVLFKKQPEKVSSDEAVNAAASKPETEQKN